MTVRDAGLIALGFLAGFVVASCSMVAMAHDVRATDDMMRALRLKYGGRVKGQG